MNKNKVVVHNVCIGYVCNQRLLLSIFHVQVTNAVLIWHMKAVLKVNFVVDCKCNISGQGQCESTSAQTWGYSF